MSLQFDCHAPSIPTNNSLPLASSLPTSNIRPTEPPQQYVQFCYQFVASAPISTYQINTLPCTAQIYALPFTRTFVEYDNSEEEIPQKKGRGADKKQRQKRQCGRCKKVPNLTTKYPYIDPCKCDGSSKGRYNCEYFDVEGVRRCRRCEKGVGGNPYRCAATTGKADDCEYFDKEGNRNR
jgi:hypothetical protein